MCSTLLELAQITSTDAQHYIERTIAVEDSSIMTESGTHHSPQNPSSQKPKMDTAGDRHNRSDFDAWAVAVKQQMLASLQKRNSR